MSCMVVIRRDREWFGSGLPLYVYVDGSKVGEIPKRYEHLVLDFASDEGPIVELWVELDGNRSKSTKVDISQGGKLQFRYALPEMPLFSSFTRDKENFGWLAPEPIR